MGVCFVGRQRPAPEIYIAGDVHGNAATIPYYLMRLPGMKPREGALIVKIATCAAGKLSRWAHLR